MPDSIAVYPDLQGLDLNPDQLKRIELVRATAKSISERFADQSDFLTVSDLRICLKAAEQEIEVTASLMQDRPRD